MPREEYLLCRILVADTGREAPEAGVRFYTAAGFPPMPYSAIRKCLACSASSSPHCRSRIGAFATAIRVSIDASDWEVIVGKGHSPEHACLFNAERNVLISGDQLLPTISSNVSVYPTEPLCESTQRLARLTGGDESTPTRGCAGLASPRQPVSWRACAAGCADRRTHRQDSKNCLSCMPATTARSRRLSGTVQGANF